MSAKAAYMDKDRLRYVRAVRAYAMAEKVAARVEAGATDAELLDDPLVGTLAAAVDREPHELIRLLRAAAIASHLYGDRRRGRVVRRVRPETRLSRPAATEQARRMTAGSGAQRTLSCESWRQPSAQAPGISCARARKPDKAACHFKFLVLGAEALQLKPEKIARRGGKPATSEIADSWRN